MDNQQNLEEMLQALTKAIDVAKEKANNALESRMINDSEWQKAKDEWGKWETIESEINESISNEKIKNILNNDLNSPRFQIEQATNHLNKSAGNIEDLNDFFSEINNGLKLVVSTIKLFSPIV
ncbi:hypothetical protein I8752_34555 [Nostocaceae cyanobacterium CENA369]|uniref:Uncharacterized protein n=1 Tax=Dendronalium phyllosphericum CENA369 TaxID=1725256 RepID=A0A8J7LKQ5_9NOST|nr:hypothetical protein [Dendronalium phyllosphericum]MBH8577984.1 hypothetical protein [Dendronalium phyllosphericum CENA369]